MKDIESKDLGAFEYKRFAFQSDRLGIQQTLGLVRPKNVPPATTLYYFHAGNADDRMLIDLGMIEQMDLDTVDLLLSKGVQFALPNFGLNFLTSARDDAKKPFREYFFEEVIPRAEEGTTTNAASRFLSGPSLGGHTALVAFLCQPHLFRGVAATMGSLLNFDFYKPEELERYVREAGVSHDFATALDGIFRGCFASYEAYKVFDPMVLLKEAPASVFDEKKILIESGAADDFGFHVGMSDFAALLSRKGIAHRFELVPGGRHESAFVMNRFVPMLRFLVD